MACNRMRHFSCVTVQRTPRYAITQGSSARLMLARESRFL
jgi:hypothetical protein